MKTHMSQFQLLVKIVNVVCVSQIIQKLFKLWKLLTCSVLPALTIFVDGIRNSRRQMIDRTKRCIQTEKHQLKALHVILQNNVLC